MTTLPTSRCKMYDRGWCNLHGLGCKDLMEEGYCDTIHLGREDNFQKLKIRHQKRKEQW